MTDMTLCASDTCEAANRCKRNPKCPDAYPWAKDRQSYSYWTPESYGRCPGYIETTRKEPEAA